MGTRTSCEDIKEIFYEMDVEEFVEVERVVDVRIIDPPQDNRRCVCPNYLSSSIQVSRMNI